MVALSKNNSFHGFWKNEAVALWWLYGGSIGVFSYIVVFYENVKTWVSFFKFSWKTKTIICKNHSELI